MSKPQKENRRADIPPDLQPATWLIHSPHRPPNVTEGSDSADLIFKAVGQMLSTWEHLETLFALLFGHLCAPDTDENWAAVRAYGSILASKSRNDMLAEAAAHVMKDDHLPSFRCLSDDMSRVASLRNIVAHGLTISIQDEHLAPVISGAKHHHEPPYFLISPPYNSKKTDHLLAPAVVYNHLSINEIEQEAIKLSKRYSLFRFDNPELLQFGLKLPPKFPRL